MRDWYNLANDILLVIQIDFVIGYTWLGYINKITKTNFLFRPVEILRW